MITSSARPLGLSQADNSPRARSIRDGSAESSFCNTRPYAPRHVVIHLNQSARGCFEKGTASGTQPICGNAPLV